jgi:hypothetical protein
MSEATSETMYGSEQASVFESGHSTEPAWIRMRLGITTQVADAHGWTLSLIEGMGGGAHFEMTDVTVKEWDKSCLSSRSSD